MVLADFFRIVETYLNTDQPTLQTAVIELRAFCRQGQVLGDIHAFSVRSGHRTAGPGVVIDIQTTATSTTHQLYFSEAGWMGHFVSSPLIGASMGAKTAQPSQAPTPKAPKTIPTPKQKSEPDAGVDAYDRAMRGL